MNTTKADISSLTNTEPYSNAIYLKDLQDGLDNDAIVQMWIHYRKNDPQMLQLYPKVDDLPSTDITDYLGYYNQIFLSIFRSLTELDKATLLILNNRPTHEEMLGIGKDADEFSILYISNYPGVTERFAELSTESNYYDHAYILLILPKSPDEINS